MKLSQKKCDARAIRKHLDRELSPFIKIRYFAFDAVSPENHQVNLFIDGTRIKTCVALMKVSNGIQWHPMSHSVKSSYSYKHFHGLSIHSETAWAVRRSKFVYWHVFSLEIYDTEFVINDLCTKMPIERFKSHP